MGERPRGGGPTPQGHSQGTDRMRKQDGERHRKDGDEEPQETERGEKREKGPPESEPKPQHDKGDLTEEAIEEGEKKTT